MLSDELPITENCMALDDNDIMVPATHCMKMIGLSGSGQPETCLTKNSSLSHNFSVFCN